MTDVAHSQLPVPERAATHPDDRPRRHRLAALLDAARDGRPLALDQIVAELSPLLWHVARAQGLDAATSEDIVQTTWLSLLRSLADIRTPEALVGWLVTVTKREAWRARDNGRRQQPAEEQTFERLRDTAPAPDEQVADLESRRALWAAVGRLSPRCQQLLRVVAFVHRPDYDAVSAALGVPRGSIGPTRGRCLAKLRELLASDPQWSSS